jgi:hypothetical protein
VRIEIMDSETSIRPAGAAVVKPDVRGGVVVEFGPADGPPMTRLRLSKREANQLGNALKAVINGRDEEILLVEE